MKVLLIQPPSQIVYDQFVRKAINRLPIGLAYIAAIAETRGHETHVIDADALRLSFSDIELQIKAFQPDIVGLTCTTPIFPIVCQLADLIHQISPYTITVLGGPHVNVRPTESLQECPHANYVIFGEGEETFAELLDYLSIGAGQPPLPGIAYRSQDHVILNPPRLFIDNLDTIPFPARHKFPGAQYFDPDRYNEPYTLMVTSRGCPYHCIFCASSATWGRKVRFRSPQNVLEEIDQVVNRFGIANITFCDDTFTLAKQRVIEICQGIVAHEYPIRFLCSSRINTIDEERLEVLANAGCKEISFGVESGDDAILQTLCKDINLQQVKPVFALVKSFGIRVHSSYIIGNPGDTHATIEKTIRFAIESGTDAAQFSLSTPYPGTSLWQKAIDQRKFQEKSFAEFKWYYSVVANLSAVTDHDLINYQREAYARFAASRPNA